MSSETAIKFLLNHFIKGRLYDRNLKHDEVFESIGGTGLKIQRFGTGTHENGSIISKDFQLFEMIQIIASILIIVYLT